MISPNKFCIFLHWNGIAIWPPNRAEKHFFFEENYLLKHLLTTCQVNRWHAFHEQGLDKSNLFYRFIEELVFSFCSLYNYFYMIIIMLSIHLLLYDYNNADTGIDVVSVAALLQDLINNEIKPLWILILLILKDNITLRTIFNNKCCTANSTNICQHYNVINVVFFLFALSPIY